LLRWFARTATDISTPLRSMTAEFDVDQATYDAVRKSVWYTGGANASDGLIRARNALNSPNQDNVRMSAAGALAIEGIAVTPSGILVTNDGWFHNGGSEQNELRSYALPAGLPAAGTQAFRTGTRVQLFGIGRIPATPAASQCIMQVGAGDPTVGTSTGAAGLYATNTAGRLALFQNSRSLIYNGLALSTEFLFFADIDLAADAGSLWINGALQGAEGQAFSGTSATDTIPRAQVRIGLSPSRPFSGEIAAAGATFGAIGLTNRQRIEGRIAHDTGRTALLPTGHPYKTSPP
jgi:hypothetical protein